MIAMPAVDLRGGRCVQLVGGRPEAEPISLPDAVGVTRVWWEAGFRELHVVDLDAALGSGDNSDLITRVITASPASTQVGGGLRTGDAVRRVLSAGADRAVVGTRALDDPPWLKALSERHPGRIVVAADVRDGLVLTRGWTRATALDAVTLAEGLAGLPLAGILCTDVAREGRLAGIDAQAMAAILRTSPHPVWVSGGITTMDDLAALADAGAAGAVLGMALYTGRLDPERVAASYPGSAPDLHDPKKGNP